MYPSEQMFYNAMKRKGWSPSEQDMQSVVAIHNGVNERAWSEVSCCAVIWHHQAPDTLRALAILHAVTHVHNARLSLHSSQAGLTPC